MTSFDPEILQDFLTESGELLEMLETDLVVLESTPRDPELIDKIFRALHTIKGSASFLALTNLVRIAHAAETALNLARSGEVVIDRPLMDLLLEAVDVLKVQFVELEAGEDLTEPEPRLVDALNQIGAETPVAATATTDGGGGGAPDMPSAWEGLPGATIVPLDLPSEKADLIDFFIMDLEESLSRFQEIVDQLADASMRESASDELVGCAESVGKSVEFFDLDDMMS
ncbi:MAG: Hpt domain-containing protein, partial [Phycisphaerales bacterium]|nr:Hpt domain-containing protein [Phycisphaerales bacterium]